MQAEREKAEKKAQATGVKKGKAEVKKGKVAEAREKKQKAEEEKEKLQRELQPPAFKYEHLLVPVGSPVIPAGTWFPEEMVQRHAAMVPTEGVGEPAAPPQYPAEELNFDDMINWNGYEGGFS